VAAVIVIATVVWAYEPAIHGEFIFDDRFEILGNEAIRTLWPPWIPMMTGGSQPHRPIPYYTFAINHAIGGLEPFGYHAFNLAVHILNGVLAGWVVRETLLRLRALGRLSGLGHAECGAVGFATAAIWLAHPLCSQAVSYVYQRMESLAALSVLLTLACFLRSLTAARPSLWRWAAVIAAALAVLCKESAAAAPLCVGLCLIVLSPDPGCLSCRSGWRSLRHNAGFLAFLASSWILAAFLVLWQKQRYSELAAPPWTPLEYLVSQPRSFARYMQLAVWPSGQSLDYLWTPSTTAWDHVPGLMILGVLTAVFVFGLRTAPGLSLGIGISLLLLAPTSTVLPVADLCVEHRMYLPLLPLVGVVVTACSVGLNSLAAATGRLGPSAVRHVIMSVGIGATLVLAVVTWNRNHAYRTEKGMWEVILATDPHHQRAAAILAHKYGAAGDFSRVERVCRQGLSAKRQFVEFQPRLLTLLAVAIVANDGSRDEAVDCARLASSLAPNLPETHGVLGDLTAAVNPYEAATAYERALSLDPRQAQARAGLAIVRERIRALENTPR